MGEDNDLFQRSIAAFAGGYPERAKKRILKLLKKDQNNLELLTLLTTIEQQYNSPQNALTTAQRITQLDPNNPQNWNNLGHLHIALRQWQKAEQCYATAATLDNAPPTIFLNHARVLIELGRPQAASLQLKHALKKSLPGVLESNIQRDPEFIKLRPLLAKLQ
ncbi:MAG: tetratricopeptide repeat protein [Promethearchaeota archaeon]